MDPNKINWNLVQSRLDRMNEKANRAVKEINQTGRLRVSVENAFRNPDELVRLIAEIALLKEYATSACAQFGTPITQDGWLDVFRIFHDQVTILPSGNLQ
jgi:hypothetical protein